MCIIYHEGILIIFIELLTGLYYVNQEYHEGILTIFIELLTGLYYVNQDYHE